MAFTYGFWSAGLEGTLTRMNACLLGWGLKSEFPAASADNKGMQAWATDEAKLYYSTGSAWQVFGFDAAMISASRFPMTRMPDMALNKIMVGQGAGSSPIEETKPIGVPLYAAGSYTGCASESQTDTNNTSYVKQHEIQIFRAGTVRIYFELYTTNPNWVYGKVYKNGGAIGTERSHQTSAWVGYSEDFTNVVSNDLLQIYIRSGSGSTVSCRYFRVQASVLVEGIAVS